MALDFQLTKDSDGTTANSQYGFSWRVSFFGPIPALLDKDFRFFLGLSALVIVACFFEFYMNRNWIWGLADYFIISLAWALVYNELRTLALLHNGFRISGPAEMQAELDRYFSSIDQESRRQRLRARGSFVMIAGLMIVQVVASNLEVRGGQQAAPMRAPVPASPPSATTVPTAEVPPPTPPTPPAKPAPPPSLPRSTFRTYDNRDIDATDLDTRKEIGLEDCSSICSLNGQCQAYSFDKWNRWCFLKTNITAMRLDPKSTSGIRSDLATPSMSTLPTVPARYRNKGFRGSGYKTLPATNFEACQSICQQDSSCVAFSFRKHELTCDLYQTTGVYSADTNAESGIFTQTP